MEGEGEGGKRERRDGKGRGKGKEWEGLILSPAIPGFATDGRKRRYGMDHG